MGNKDNHKSFEEIIKQTPLNKEQEQPLMDKLLCFAYDLQKVTREGKKQMKAGKRNTNVIANLLRYLMINKHNPEVDITLLHFLQAVLGLRDSNLQKKKEIDKEKIKKLFSNVKEHEYKVAVFRLYSNMGDNMQRMQGLPINNPNLAHLRKNIINTLQTSMPYTSGEIKVSHKPYKFTTTELLEKTKHSDIKDRQC